ncbi:MAG: hypothetical protein KA368_17940, partial [Acidobacteria bacterium]|nr:hypothetical protein [Acidobacteriota bacterium]
MTTKSLIRACRAIAMLAVLFTVVSPAYAQFDKLKKRIPGLGGSSEIDNILSQMDGARVKSAYA